MSVSEKARQYLRLHLAEAIGPVLLGRMIKYFGSVDAIFEASMAELMQVEGIGERRARAAFSARNDAAADREIEKAASLGVRIICWEDAEYPPQLRHCDDPPICLFIRGSLQPEDAVAVAIVGSRKCSRYGYEQARRFGALLAGAGFTVVSGLARGVDGHAHEGALIGRGRTVAVLGCGVDQVYPPEHADLAGRILEAGALLSEDPLGSPPSADSFPRRNRIIAGMCLGVIVVEASKRSGALITARLATEYNREVFAVPGRVDTPMAAGPNELIRSGAAKLVSSLEDVLDELGEVGRLMASADRTGESMNADSSSPAGLLDTEYALLDALAEGEVYVDELVARAGLDHGATLAHLTRMQLKGLVVALPGNRFARRKV